MEEGVSVKLVVKRRERGRYLCVVWMMPAGLMGLLSSGQGPEPVDFSCATVTSKLVKLTGKRGGN